MINRRSFLKYSGLGILVLYTVDISELIARRTFQFRNYPTDLNAYLLSGEDGRVTFFTGKIEMGQGVVTSLPQMLAEERVTRWWTAEECEQYLHSETCPARPTP